MLTVLWCAGVGAAKDRLRGIDMAGLQSYDGFGVLPMALRQACHHACCGAAFLRLSVSEAGPGLESWFVDTAYMIARPISQPAMGEIDAIRAGSAFDGAKSGPRADACDTSRGPCAREIMRCYIGPRSGFFDLIPTQLTVCRWYDNACETGAFFPTVAPARIRGGTVSCFSDRAARCFMEGSSLPVRWPRTARSVPMRRRTTLPGFGVAGQTVRT